MKMSAGQIIRMRAVVYKSFNVLDIKTGRLILSKGCARGKFPSDFLVFSIF